MVRGTPHSGDWTSDILITNVQHVVDLVSEDEGGDTESEKIELTPVSSASSVSVSSSSVSVSSSSVSVSSSSISVSSSSVSVSSLSASALLSTKRVFNSVDEEAGNFNIFSTDIIKQELSEIADDQQLPPEDTSSPQMSPLKFVRVGDDNETPDKSSSESNYIEKNDVKSNIKMYSCPHCPHMTHLHNSLVVHIRQHTGERPFKCPVCRFRGIQHSSIAYHMRASHPNCLVRIILYGQYCDLILILLINFCNKTSKKN